MSHRSEMDAFHKAKAMLLRMGVPINSLRLEKYFSCGKIIKKFGFATTLFLIPKKNIHKVGVWASILARVVVLAVDFLSQYFYRNLSESGFLSDKRRFGGFIWQRWDDRQEVALFSVAFLHNIYAIRVNPK
ncbi:MAG: hypothetical protein LBQ98_08010 [Nitrososphaerota archaeon]|nr:hypothetical protein [Nitrososphaerota archaeon]